SAACGAGPWSSCDNFWNRPRNPPGTPEKEQQLLALLGAYPDALVAGRSPESSDVNLPPTLSQALPYLPPRPPGRALALFDRKSPGGVTGAKLLRSSRFWRLHSRKGIPGWRRFPQKKTRETRHRFV